MAPARLARRRAVRRRNRLGFDLGVAEVVAMGAYPFPELPPAAVEALVDRTLALADATHLRARRYPELSGGEQQRVQFARVLTQCLAARAEGEARYLLLDEPTASLDPRHQGELLRVAVDLARDERVGVLVILHDMNLAALVRPAAAARRWTRHRVRTAVAGDAGQPAPGLWHRRPGGAASAGAGPGAGADRLRGGGAVPFRGRAAGRIGVSGRPPGGWPRHFPFISLPTGFSRHACFDVVSEVDKHELTNAIDQANRELATRFDFKGTDAKFELEGFVVTQVASSAFQLKQMLDILRGRLSARGIDVRCLDVADPLENLGGARQKVTIKQGIEQPVAKKLIAAIKAAKLKVESQINGDKLRITGKKRDDLQTAIALLKKTDVDLPLQFENFRD